jgi:hypothetical protein
VFFWVPEDEETPPFGMILEVSAGRVSAVTSPAGAAAVVIPGRQGSLGDRAGR